MDCFAETEERLEAAKARLVAAQQEKLEAAAEFLAARAALRQALEALWPSRCECSDTAATEKAEMRQALILMR